MSEVEDAGLKVDWLGGNCPVQAEGHIDGAPFYFRSRGERWSFTVGEDPFENPVFHYEEPYGSWPDAGWISEDEARAFIAKGVDLYREFLATKGTRDPEVTHG